MKQLLFCLTLLAAAAPALAQSDPPDQAERTRIAAERNKAEARLKAQEAACYKTFAVNDCVSAARAERRERLADLRRQELSLNDADRRRRSAERLRSIEERETAQQQEDKAKARAESVARQQDHQEALERRAAEKARPATPAAPRKAKPPRVHDSAEELRLTQERRQEAQERRERVARRQAESAKSTVKPLPVAP